MSDFFFSGQKADANLVKLQSMLCILVYFQEMKQIVMLATHNYNTWIATTHIIFPFFNVLQDISIPCQEA